MGHGARCANCTAGTAKSRPLQWDPHSEEVNAPLIEPLIPHGGFLISPVVDRAARPPTSGWGQRSVPCRARWFSCSPRRLPVSPRGPVEVAALGIPVPRPPRAARTMLAWSARTESAGSARSMFAGAAWSVLVESAGSARAVLAGAARPARAVFARPAGAMLVESAGSTRPARPMSTGSGRTAGRRIGWPTRLMWPGSLRCQRRICVRDAGSDPHCRCANGAGEG